MIYFDNAATTRPSPEVCETVLTAMREYYGNPSSLHGKGLEAERLIREARADVSRLAGVGADTLYFTAGGTEANNLAILGVCHREPRSGYNRVLTTQTEHPSVLEPVREAERRGWRVTYIPVNGSGVLDPEKLETELDENVALISLAHVNNETGTVQPIEDVIALRDRKCPEAQVHVDCVQSFGKMPIRAGFSGADFISVSAHKIHGPKGVGALYASGRKRAAPVIFGGGQENGVRPGTENAPAIAGFGAAVRETANSLTENADHVRRLGEALLRGLTAVGVQYIRISGQAAQASPYILSLAFPGVPAELMLNHLDREGVCVSAGAACSSRRAAKTGSRVLSAMGIKHDIIKSVIRFSFSKYNTVSEIEAAVDIIKRILCDIEVLSGWRKSYL